CQTALPFIEPQLSQEITQQALALALNPPLQRILEQVTLALEASNARPDVIYLTGGSARSPLIREALQTQLPGIPVQGGDDFG
ncbi:molecular chaperone, partial [Enterobacter kobei]|nr:molecular chaperone [Enterobacter kobei]